jgi:ATP-dependent DNA helicase RecG
VQTLRKETVITPDTPLQYLKGVGEARVTQLAAAGLESVRDLLFFFPFRYEDRRHPLLVRDLASVETPVTLRGRIVSAGSRITPVRRVNLFEAMFDDGSGSIMLVWFNQPYLVEQIHRGDQLVIYGQPRLNTYRRFQIENPEFEKIRPGEEPDEEGVILPVYAGVSGISPRRMRQLVLQALQAVAHLDDPLPPELAAVLEVEPLKNAIVKLHYPDEVSDELYNFRSAAHRRIILQELFTFQLALRVRRAAEEQKEKKRTIAVSDSIREKVRRILPFKLTPSQRRVVKEIVDDLQSPRPMYRLLQGDVGSGKTIVALIAALVLIENGEQVALLAPSEILAEQHFQRISQLVDGAVRLARLTGSTPARKKKEILAKLATGEIDLVIGTHALLEPKVTFRSLGLAIVDEQHRFGVAQRQKLFEKGHLVDILVMTATPIPRSLALALYGDLELSVIDELPPGRIPIRTLVRGTGQIRKIYGFLEEHLREREQAYIVFPIIEESEKVDLKAITTGFESISAAFPGRRAAMLHGRLPAEEKERTMAAFNEGAIDILVSTTVIEVGIDIPNASIMLIMDADRFGLSQLHQLRGRIGRGARKSYCILLRDEESAEAAKERLRAFEAAADGFAVAERDLQLRGAGDFFGTRQAGVPRFRFADILRDHALMEKARDAAIAWIATHRFEAAKELCSRLSPDLRIRTRD